MEQNRKPRHKLSHIWSMNYDKEAKNNSEEKTVSSINGIEKIRQPCAKELNWTTILQHIQK